VSPPRTPHLPLFRETADCAVFRETPHLPPFLETADYHTTMTQQTVPHESAQTTAESVREYSFADIGIVTSTPTQTPDGAHHVAVQETRIPADTPLPVVPPVHGDFYVPPEGTPVLVIYTGENRGVVIGSPVPQTTSPAVTGGERILSHPKSDANVRFNTDGTLDIYGDTTVRINGGSKGVVHDVSTTTDAQGHVTSVSLQRRTDILI